MFVIQSGDDRFTRTGCRNDQIPIAIVHTAFGAELFQDAFLERPGGNLREEASLRTLLSGFGAVNCAPELVEVIFLAGFKSLVAPKPERRVLRLALAL